jgi:type I restriction enzyme S subunit
MKHGNVRLTAQQLRNSILQLAVQGKLVPQDPYEEPASVLLEKIRGEKLALVKSGKIKKGKPLKPITDEEIPFDIPVSWEWVRLGKAVHDLGQKKPDQQFSYIDVGSIDNLNGKLSNDENILQPENAPSRARKIIKQGAVIYSTVRPYLLNICIIDKIFSKEPIASTAFAVMYTDDYLFNKYLYYILRSQFFIEYVNINMIGVAYPAINDTTLYNAIIPVPPLAEQKRIVTRIEELMRLVDTYDKAEQKLTALNAVFPDLLKKAVLQDAIQGKLMPQTLSDEPASVLLEKIRKEKQSFVKIGKNKKEKPLKPIMDEEIPFEIPAGWEWVRLGEIVDINPRNTADDDTITSFVPMNLISDGYQNKFTCEIKKWQDIKSGFTHFCDGDIAIAKITPCFQNRKSVVFENLQNGIGAGTTELHILRPYSNYSNVLYLFWFCKTVYFIQNGVKTFTGTAGQQRIGLPYIANCLFPLPPLPEQKRIVAKIDDLFTVIEEQL